MLTKNRKIEHIIFMGNGHHSHVELALFFYHILQSLDRIQKEEKPNRVILVTALVQDIYAALLGVEVEIELGPRFMLPAYLIKDCYKWATVAGGLQQGCEATEWIDLGDEMNKIFAQYGVTISSTMPIVQRGPNSIMDRVHVKA